LSRFINKLVRITLKTGVGVEGWPIHWDDKEVIIAYEDSDNTTTIFNPRENIMMVSAFGAVVEEPEQASEIIPPPVEPPPVELNSYEPDPTLRAMKMAELHIEKKKALKEQLDNHFKNKTAVMPANMTYDTPDYTK
jgi:hypothetical protein